MDKLYPQDNPAHTFASSEIHVGHGERLEEKLRTLLENLSSDPDALEKFREAARKLGQAQGREAFRGSNRAERRAGMANTIGYPCRGNPAKASRRATVRQAKRRGLIKQAREAHLKAVEEKANAA